MGIRVLTRTASLPCCLRCHIAGQCRWYIAPESHQMQTFIQGVNYSHVATWMPVASGCLSRWSLVAFVAFKQVFSPHSVICLGKDQCETSLARIGKLGFEMTGSLYTYSILAGLIRVQLPTHRLRVKPRLSKSGVQHLDTDFLRSSRLRLRHLMGLLRIEYAHHATCRLKSGQNGVPETAVYASNGPNTATHGPLEKHSYPDFNVLHRHTPP